MPLRAYAQALLAPARVIRLRPATPFCLARRYHSSPILSASKDDQDPQALRPRRAEGTLSGSDDQLAAKKEVAFKAKQKNTPEDAMASVADREGNLLEASGANQGFSKPPTPEEPFDKSVKTAKSGEGNKKKHGNLSGAVYRAP